MSQSQSWMQNQAKPINSEAYRQMLVRDGERRHQEWQTAYRQHQQRYQQAIAQTRSAYIPSEQYRQMLVRDGDRRFQEWHQNFLDYQTKFNHQNKTL